MRGIFRFVLLSALAGGCVDGTNEQFIGSSVQAIETRSDTAARLLHPSYTQYGPPVLLAGEAFYTGQSSDGFGLYATRGTAADTRLVANPTHASEIGALRPFVATNGKLLLSVWTADVLPFLWASDGTTDSAAPLVSQTGRVASWTRLGDKVVVIMDVSDGGGPAQLWSTDGTPTGTVQLGTFQGDGYRNWALGDLGAAALLRLDDGIHGIEPWITDGTVAGTKMLKDISVGSSSSFPGQRAITLRNGRFLFSVSGGALWVTDGTEAGTTALVDASGTPICCLRDHLPEGKVPGGEFAYLQVTDPTGAVSLLRTDGTASGTEWAWNPDGTLLSERPHAPIYLQHGDSVWRTDGTSAGSRRLFVKARERFPELQVTALRDTDRLTAEIDGVGLFSGTDASNGEELWRSDGTDTGSMLVWDLVPGVEPSRPAWALLMGENVLVAFAMGVEGPLFPGTFPGEVWTFPRAALRDFSAPALGCSDATITSLSDSGIVWEPNVEATDETAPVTMAIVPTAGTTLTPGTHPIHVSARDGIGNASECSFEVTVVAPPPPLPDPDVPPPARPAYGCGCAAAPSSAGLSVSLLALLGPCARRRRSR